MFAIAETIRTVKQSEARAPWAAVLGVVLLVTGCGTTSSQSSNQLGVQLTKLDDRVRVEMGGQLFTEYVFKGAAKPYCYPVIGPSGAGMTRDWPMKETPGEEHDHPHHRGFWFGHGEVNGVDVWTDKDAKTGKVVHKGFSEIKSGKDGGVIVSLNDWVDSEGKVLCTDETTLRFYNSTPIARWFDFEITLHAVSGGVLLGDSKEGTLAFRIAESMRLAKPKDKTGKTPPGDGHIVNSDGVRDGDAWGKHGAWVDCFGPVGGRTVGVAIMDHPSNLRHPTTWHARDYGLLAANPFGLHDFEKKPKGEGDHTIPAGKSLTLRYRILLHDGDEKQGRVAERYAEFVGGNKASLK